MSQKDSATPAEEVKDTAPTAPASDAPAEETIADAIKEEKQKTPDSIPYSRFQEKVQENNDLKTQLQELEARAEDPDASNKEVAADLQEIAEEHSIDPEVLEKLADKLYSKTQQTIEEKLAPLAHKEKMDTQNQLLKQMFDKAIENNPQYEGVADLEVISQLALNPANADKTMSQLFEKVYAGATQQSDRKTMETTTPGKTEVIDKVDYERAQSDAGYFQQIKSDPKLKEEYNKEMLNQVSRYM